MKLRTWLAWYKGRTIYTRPGPDRVQRKVGVLHVDDPTMRNYSRTYSGFLMHEDGRIFKLVEIRDIDGNVHDEWK
jgi:hypothetical protein